MKDLLLNYGNKLTDRQDSNLTRKAVYRFYVKEKHGSLGQHVRVEIPRCVIIGVRAVWPSENFMYMGHK